MKPPAEHRRGEATVIIPARYDSTRLPGKPLLDIGGRPMIEHVYRRASAARSVAAVIVATDDTRVFQTVEEFGGLARMTSPDHMSGTDRIAEVARTLEPPIVVNVQGDEPLIEPEMIDLVVEPLFDPDGAEMSTLATRFRDVGDIWDPNVVKVTISRSGRAIYFSRAPIPFRRDAWRVELESEEKGARWDIAGDVEGHYKHIGIYAYKRSFLLRYAEMEPTPLEKLEQLEQLRALENDFPIQVVLTSHDTIGVDTEEDLSRIRAMVESRKAGTQE